MKTLAASSLSLSLAMLMGSTGMAEELSPDDFLHLAAASGNTKAIKVQLEAGADINAKNDAGDTALHIAIKKRGYIEFVMEILKQGADPNVTDARGQTPLFLATLNAMVLRHGYSAMYQNRPKFEEHLRPIEFTLDPDKPRANLKREDWDADIRKALGPGEVDPNAMTLLKALLEAGANPDVKDKQGFTPRDLAKAHGNYERLAKIMGLKANTLSGMEGSCAVMHGGATYWVTVHGGHHSTKPLKLFEAWQDQK